MGKSYRESGDNGDDKYESIFTDYANIKYNEKDKRRKRLIKKKEDKRKYDR